MEVVVPALDIGDEGGAVLGHVAPAVVARGPSVKTVILLVD